MTNTQTFDQAFGPELTVEYLTDDKLIANVTDRGVTLLVTAYYCAHCRDSADGAAWCAHKEAAFHNTRFPGDYEEYAQEKAEMAAMAVGR